jgi:hypothetical protein
MPPEGIDALENVARSIPQDEAMLTIFRRFYQSTVLDGNWHREWSDYPFDSTARERYGEQVSLFYLLAYLSALPLAAQEYQRRGIDPAIFDDTLREISTWYVHEYELCGHWAFRQFDWIWRSLTCVLFRLGRLQFMLSTFQGDVHAFRRRSTGAYILLADPQLPLRADGCALGAGQPDGPLPEDVSWKPVYEARPDGWWGHPVSPYGQAQPQPVLLTRAEWELALQPGDDVLDMHIPRADPFGPSELADSLRRAEAFFPRQYPDRPSKAFFCHTWFFTPQLQQMLPAQSNIVHFQREFYLYPNRGGPEFLWSFTFGERYPNAATAPHDTSLRRAVLDWMAQGKEIFDLTGLRFHGADSWGQQPYMRAWDQAHPASG